MSPGLGSVPGRDRRTDRATIASTRLALRAVTRKTFRRLTCIQRTRTEKTDNLLCPPLHQASANASMTLGLTSLVCKYEYHFVEYFNENICKQLNTRTYQYYGVRARHVYCRYSYGASPHSVTFHPTQSADGSVLDSATPEGWKAELT